MYCEECDTGCSVDGTGDNCNKEPDHDYTDLYGNALRCKCSAGYLKSLTWTTAYDDADGDWPTGENVGFTCLLAHGGTATEPTGDYTAYADGSGQTRCGRSTSGLKKSESVGAGTLGDCYCGNENTDGTFGLRVLVETTGGGEYRNKSCHACVDRTAVVTSAGTYAGVTFEVDYYSCQRCPDPHMDMAADQCATCDTAAGYASTPYGLVALGPQFCVYENHATFISATYDTTEAYSLTYGKLQESDDARANSVLTIDESYTLKHFFINASANCYFYKGPENIANCQTLANLCVLVMYDTTHPACEAFNDIEGLRGAGNLQQNGWGEALPWLYYEETASLVRYDDSINMVLGFSKSASGVDASRLTFFLSIYAINGTWMGMQELTTQLFYCGTERPNTHRGGGSSSSTAWLNYGNNFRKNFQCDLSTLINEEPLFYELFVLDEGNSDDGASSLYPCPVLLKDYQDNNGGSLNRNKEKDSEDDDVFVRRFMLYDTLSSVSSGYEGNLNGAGIYPRVVRYAKELRIMVKALPNDGSHIYPPVLEITYQERLPDLGNWDEGMKKDQIKFGVDYSQDRGEDYHDTFSVFFSITSVLAGVTGFFRYLYWGYRNSRIASKERKDLDSDGRGGPEAGGLLGGVGSDSLLKGRECEGFQRVFRSTLWCAVVMLCHVFTLYTFALLFTLTTCYFVFFKMQSKDIAAVMLLPPRNGDWEDGEDNPYKFIWVLIYCCFFSQTAFVAHLIHMQCTAEVFFVDMESRRSVAIPGQGPALSSGARRGDLQPLGAPPRGAGGRAGQPPGTDGGSGSAAFDPLAEDDGVSGWRRIFIANEWNKLQSARRTSLEFTLFWMAFALIGQDVQYVAMPQPDINNHDRNQCGEDDHFHMFLRFASHTWWFVVMELFQLFGMQAMRYLDACFKCQTHPFEMKGELFLDLCTQAKVSVIMLDEPYHGYVLYCDSSSDTADTSLKNLTAQLLLTQSQDQQLGHGPADLANRPGFEDVQAFELYMSDGWLKWYMNLKKKLQNMARDADLSDAMALGGSGRGGRRPVGMQGGGEPRIVRGMPGGSRGGAGACASCRATLSERNAVLAVGAMEVLNEKLKKFLRRQYKGDLAWEATEAFSGNWWSWLYRRVRRPPDLVRSAASENIIVPDMQRRFTSLSLYGIEFELWLQNVLTMAICDIWFNDVATSLFCTYIVYHIFRTSRQFFGRHNLAHTSLVDKSFLA